MALGSVLALSTRFMAPTQFLSDLADVLPAVLSLLTVSDVIVLSQTCKWARIAVINGWRYAYKPQIRAMVVASMKNSVLLLNPLSGAILSTHAVAYAQDAREPWPTSVAVCPATRRCWISQYKGSAFAEHSLPDLNIGSVQSLLPLEPLLGESLVEPEGIVQAHGRIYIAWAGSGCITSRMLAPGAKGPAESRRLPGDWVPWGMQLGLDNALYVAVNPAFKTPKGETYGHAPPVRGRGTVARIFLNEQGLFVGRVRSFTVRGHLSRPSGLCFDGAGDLFVTHMGSQVLKFAGPLRAEPGQLLGVFIDTRQHGLAPASAALPPQPFDICWCRGLFFLTTHTCAGKGEEENGSLSVWDGHGTLLQVHNLAPHRHPNMLEVWEDGSGAGG